MSKSIAYNKAFKLTIDIVKFCTILKKEKKEVDLIDDSQFAVLFDKTDELGKILFSVLKTTRIQANSN